MAIVGRVLTKSKKKSGHKNQSSKKKNNNISSNPQVGYIDGLRANDEENDHSDNDRAMEQTFDRRNGTLIKIEVLSASSVACSTA